MAALARVPLRSGELAFAALFNLGIVFIAWVKAVVDH